MKELVYEGQLTLDEARKLAESKGIKNVVVVYYGDGYTLIKGTKYGTDRKPHDD